MTPNVREKFFRSIMRNNASHFSHSAKSNDEHIDCLMLLFANELFDEKHFQNLVNLMLSDQSEKHEEAKKMLRFKRNDIISRILSSR